MQQFLAYDRAALRHHIHGLLVSAMQALAGAGRTVCDCTAAVPWECTMDMARQVWDTARHVDIFLRLLAHIAGSSALAKAPHPNPLPEGRAKTPSADTVAEEGKEGAQTPEACVAGVNRALAGLAGDKLAQLIELVRQSGDPVIERTLDFVVADALTHVRMGSTWLRALPAAAPERLRKALEFQHSSAE